MFEKKIIDMTGNYKVLDYAICFELIFNSLFHKSKKYENMSVFGKLSLNFKSNQYQNMKKETKWINSIKFVHTYILRFSGVVYLKLCPLQITFLTFRIQ